MDEDVYEETIEDMVDTVRSPGVIKLVVSGTNEGVTVCRWIDRAEAELNALAMAIAALESLKKWLLKQWEEGLALVKTESTGDEDD